nr:MAG TPA: hypothetical protein [Crassvirales sp.]
MSKGKKYKIPHKYLHKYPVRKWNINGCRRRYKVMGGKNGEKAKFKFFRHKKLWKLLDGHISMRKMVSRNIWWWY